MADNLPDPASRKEEYLAKAAGKNGITLPEPASREEIYLDAIANNGGGGGGGSYTAGTGIDIEDNTISVDTTTIQEKLTAGSNITISDNVISASGGGSVTPVQTPGNSTTDIMSQDAVTSMVFGDPTIRTRIKIGNNTYAGIGDEAIEIGKEAKAANTRSIAIGGESQSNTGYGIAIGSGANSSGAEAITIGYNATAYGAKGVSLGRSTSAGHSFSVALGAGATTSSQGELNVGTGSLYTTSGYNNTNYRLISGVHDPVNAHDAATKGYVDTHSGGGSSVIQELTSDDYNFDSTLQGGAYDSVALWKLPTGLYCNPDMNNVSVIKFIDNSNPSDIWAPGAEQGFYNVYSEGSGGNAQISTMGLSGYEGFIIDVDTGYQV